MPRLRAFKWVPWAESVADRFYRDGPKQLAVDTETSGFGFYDEAFCVTVAWLAEGRVQSGYFELAEPQACELIAGMLDSTDQLVFHNAKFDLQKLIAAGVLDRAALTPERIVDTECVAHLLDEHRLKKLEYLSSTLLGHDRSSEAKVIKKARDQTKKRLGLKSVKEVGYHHLPREVIVPYAINDAEDTIRLYEYLWPELVAASGLPELHLSEMGVLLATLDMEAAGNRLDVPYLHDAMKQTRTAILKHELAIEKHTGLKVWYPEKSGQSTPEGCINPNSNDQIREAIAARGIELDNTRADTLKPLDDDLVRAVLGLRAEHKLLGTYLMNMEKERRGDIIHPNFKLFKPKTGRTSSAGEDGD